MDLELLIEDIMSEPGLDRKKIIKLLSNGIKAGKSECELCEEIYRESYSHLTPVLCEELISKMSNENRSGNIWSIEDVNSVAKKLDIEFSDKNYTPEELRTAMTMEYYELYTPLKKSGVSLEPTGWARIADYALTKHPKKLIDCYFSQC